MLCIMPVSLHDSPGPCHEVLHGRQQPPSCSHAECSIEGTMTLRNLHAPTYQSSVYHDAHES